MEIVGIMTAIMDVILRIMVRRRVLDGKYLNAQTVYGIVSVIAITALNVSPQNIKKMIVRRKTRSGRHCEANGDRI